MKLKKYNKLLLISLIVPFLFVGCNKKDVNNNNNSEIESKEDELIYKTVPVGRVEYVKTFDEFDLEEDKFIRQWIIDNKETEGVYKKIQDGYTYVMWSLGTKKTYGHGFGSVQITKEKEDGDIIISSFVSKPSFVNNDTEVLNYPYIAFKIEGNIKENFISKDLSKESVPTPPVAGQELQNNIMLEENIIENNTTEVNTTTETNEVIVEENLNQSTDIVTPIEPEQPQQDIVEQPVEEVVPVIEESEVQISEPISQEQFPPQ